MYCYELPLKKPLEVVSCEKLSVNVIWFRGAQIQCSRSPGRLHFLRWRLIFVGPLCGTCFVSHFCRLQFGGGCYFCVKLVDFWSNLLTDISSYVVWNAWPCVADKNSHVRTWNVTRCGHVEHGQRHSSAAKYDSATQYRFVYGCSCPWDFYCGGRGRTRDSLQMFSNSLFLHLHLCNRKRMSCAHRHVFRLACRERHCMSVKIWRNLLSWSSWWTETDIWEQCW